MIMDYAENRDSENLEVAFCFFITKINWCAGVMWIICWLLWCFFSWLNYDGTHSLQGIHWQAMHSKSFPMKKQTLHLGWPENESIFRECKCFWGELSTTFWRIFQFCLAASNGAEKKAGGLIFNSRFNILRNLSVIHFGQHRFCSWTSFTSLT